MVLARTGVRVPWGTFNQHGGAILMDDLERDVALTCVKELEEALRDVYNR